MPIIKINDVLPYFPHIPKRGGNSIYNFLILNLINFLTTFIT